MADFLRLSLLCLAVLAAAQGFTWLISRRRGRLAIVDVTWGLGLALVGFVALLFGNGDLTRRGVLAAIVMVWGVRLSSHIAARSKGKGEDPRYAALAEGRSAAAVAVKVFVVQGLAQWFISLPVQVSASTGAASGLGGVVLVVGVAVALTGLVLESTADRQLKAFKADPANKGQIMDRGLWGWSRHPNYFGDACVWVGVWIAAASVWPGVLTIASPAAMVWFLVVATGARLLERQMADRPGYAEYQARTSFFVPLPPRSAA